MAEDKCVFCRSISAENSESNSNIEKIAFLRI